MSNDNSKSSITFALRSTAFEEDPQGADAYYAEIGKIVCIWGRFEQQFTMAVRIIFSLREAEPIKNDFPVPFSSKLKFWRKAFRQLPSLAEQKEYALRFADDAMEAALDRHDIMHSNWGEFISTDPLTVKAVNMRPKGKTYLHTTFEITLPTLQKIRKRIDDLNTRLVPLTWFLASLTTRLARLEGGRSSGTVQTRQR